VAGLVALKSLPNGVPEHEPCIFKFFLLPRLVTRIKEFKIKESVVVRQTRRRGMKMNLRIDRRLARAVHILSHWLNYFCSQWHLNF